MAMPSLREQGQGQVSTEDGCYPAVCQREKPCWIRVLDWCKDQPWEGGCKEWAVGHGRTKQGVWGWMDQWV